MLKNDFISVFCDLMLRSAKKRKTGRNSISIVICLSIFLIDDKIKNISQFNLTTQRELFLILEQCNLVYYFRQY